MGNALQDDLCKEYVNTTEKFFNEKEMRDLNTILATVLEASVTNIIISCASFLDTHNKYSAKGFGVLVSEISLRLDQEAEKYILSRKSWGKNASS